MIIYRFNCYIIFSLAGSGWIAGVELGKSAFTAVGKKCLGENA